MSQDELPCSEDLVDTSNGSGVRSILDNLRIFRQYAEEVVSELVKHILGFCFSGFQHQTLGDDLGEV